MKKLLPFLLALTVATAAHAFSFSAPATSGQTLYFTITEGTNVKIVAPVTASWNGYTAPAGHLAIPATVVDGGTTYHVTAIDRMAFQGCTALTSVDIAGSVVSIGQRAFADDTMLHTAILQEGVQRIDMMAFLSCTALDTIELPSTLTRIAMSAFENTAYYNDMENWSSEMMLTLGQWVLKTGNQAVGTLHVHEGVVGIANNAMYYCRNIEMVTLPTTLRYIGDGAFKDCYALDTVQLHSTVPPAISDDSFEDIDPLPVLVVPCSTATVYSSTQYWNAFTRIEEMPCPNAIDDIATASPLMVTVVDGGVMVQGATVGSMLTVCDMMGRRIGGVRCVESESMTFLPLPAAGIYVLLSSDGPAVKISYSK